MSDERDQLDLFHPTEVTDRYGRTVAIGDPVELDPEGTPGRLASINHRLKGFGGALLHWSVTIELDAGGPASVRANYQMRARRPVAGG